MPNTADGQPVKLQRSPVDKLTALDRRTITLSMPEQARPHFAQPNEVSIRLTQAFERLGYQLEVAFNPSLRSLALANTGQVDGEVSRSPSIEIEYPNLLRVDVPTNYLHPAIYAVDDVSHTRGNDWRYRPIKLLAIGRGSSLLPIAIPTALKGSQLVKTNSTLQGLQLLNSGRIDALLLTRVQFELVGQQQPELTERLAALTPALPSHYFYTYLHKRHRLLVPALREQLLQLTGSAGGQPQANNNQLP